MINLIKLLTLLLALFFSEMAFGSDAQINYFCKKNMEKNSQLLRGVFFLKEAQKSLLKKVKPTKRSSNIAKGGIQ